MAGRLPRPTVVVYARNYTTAIGTCAMTTRQANDSSTDHPTVVTYDGWRKASVSTINGVNG